MYVCSYFHVYLHLANSRCQTFKNRFDYVWFFGFFFQGCGVVHWIDWIKLCAVNFQAKVLCVPVGRAERRRPDFPDQNKVVRGFKLNLKCQSERAGNASLSERVNCCAVFSARLTPDRDRVRELGNSGWIRLFVTLNVMKHFTSTCKVVPKRGRSLGKPSRWVACGRRTGTPRPWAWPWAARSRSRSWYIYFSNASWRNMNNQCVSVTVKGNELCSDSLVRVLSFFFHFRLRC
jgi:hypothetical protein